MGWTRALLRTSGSAVVAARQRVKTVCLMPGTCSAEAAAEGRFALELAASPDGRLFALVQYRLRGRHDEPEAEDASGPTVALFESATLKRLPVGAEPEEPLREAPRHHWPFFESNEHLWALGVRMKVPTLIRRQSFAQVARGGDRYLLASTTSLMLRLSAMGMSTASGAAQRWCTAKSPVRALPPEPPLPDVQSSAAGLTERAMAQRPPRDLSLAVQGDQAVVLADEESSGGETAQRSLWRVTPQGQTTRLTLPESGTWKAVSASPHGSALWLQDEGAVAVQSVDAAAWRIIPVGAEPHVNFRALPQDRALLWRYFTCPRELLSQKVTPRELELLYAQDLHAATRPETVTGKMHRVQLFFSAESAAQQLAQLEQLARTAREQGVDLATVLEQAPAEIRGKPTEIRVQPKRRTYPAELEDALLRARPGEVVGPIRIDDHRMRETHVYVPLTRSWDADPLALFRFDPEQKRMRSVSLRWPEWAKGKDAVTESSATRAVDGDGGTWGLEGEYNLLWHAGPDGMTVFFHPRTREEQRNNARLYAP